MKKITISAISKNLGINSKEIYSILSESKLIYRKNDDWLLTTKGKEYGGEVLFSKKYSREYTVWPEDFDPRNLDSSKRQTLLSATKVGEKLDVSSQRLNRILAEIGWISKGIKGWNVTNIGRNLGGVEFEHDSGGTYVLWPESILQNKTLLGSFNTGKNYNNTNEQETPSELETVANVRDKWPTPYRTKDGHRVRSRGEQMIDDYLYECGIVHAYEREVKNIKEKILCDFFIPTRNGGEAVYIEYWGKEDEKYDLRKADKKEIYLKHDLNLIELENKHIYSLDDHLPRLLLKYKIRTD